MIEMMDLMDNLSFMFPDELENVTRCRRPCQYYVYNLAEDLQEFSLSCCSYIFCGGANLQYSDTRGAGNHSYF